MKFGLSSDLVSLGFDLSLNWDSVGFGLLGLGLIGFGRSGAGFGCAGFGWNRGKSKLD